MQSRTRTNNRFNTLNSIPKRTAKTRTIPAPSGAWAKPLQIKPEPSKDCEKPNDQTPKVIQPKISKRKQKPLPPPVDSSDDSGIEEYEDMYEDLTEPW